MSAYIRDLQGRQARLEEERAAAEQAATAKARAERLIPLDVRLSRLLASIPEDIQSEGLSLEHLRDRLRGRSGGKAHSGELGTALRRLKFTRKRQWAAGTGFKALWYPPTYR